MDLDGMNGSEWNDGIWKGLEWYLDEMRGFRWDLNEWWDLNEI